MCSAYSWPWQGAVVYSNSALIQRQGGVWTVPHVLSRPISIRYHWSSKNAGTTSVWQVPATEAGATCASGPPPHSTRPIPPRKKIRHLDHHQSNRHSFFAKIIQPDVGLEPTTLRLRVSRATDCASRACCCCFDGSTGIIN